VEKPKGHVNKSLVVQALQNCKKREKVQYFNKKNAITLVRAKKG
jgi:hypothetical protein